MKNRLLIVSCSATKDEAPGLLPALERYKGAYYQMIKPVPVEERPEIIILSALFGFISSCESIPNYNTKMDGQRAFELLGDPRTSRQWRGLVDPWYDEIFIAAGANYRSVIDRFLPRVEAGKIKVAFGGIGMQRQQLKAWLAEGKP